MKNKITDILLATIGVIVIIFAVIGVMDTFRPKNKINNTIPVEESKKVDSIIIVNQTIKAKVDILDSIKDAKIIEVKSLDNDSTIKLFYRLVSEE